MMKIILKYINGKNPLFKVIVNFLNWFKKMTMKIIIMQEKSSNFYIY